MSLIPSTAVGAALTPAQRSSNELIRARKVQSAKDHHHSEEVEELDDTAVSSIDGNAEENEGRQAEKKRSGRTKPDEERVDIESLKGSEPAAQEGGQKSENSRLDISA